MAKHRLQSSYPARRLLASATATGALLMVGSPAFAAPITCPEPQQAVKVDGGGWECQNRGGNLSGAAETKNPND